ncbi:MAG: hypothetical protein ACJATE_002441 [Bacteroidia bacterium]|jgi:hypothetical protein
MNLEPKKPPLIGRTAFLINVSSKYQGQVVLSILPSSTSPVPICRFIRPSLLVVITCYSAEQRGPVKNYANLLKRVKGI